MAEQAIELRYAVPAQRAARRRRTLTTTATLGLGAFGLFVVTMMVGSFGLSAWEVIGSVFHLRSDPAADFVVRELRLPTALTGLLVGMSLGVAGILFQKLLGNPLASPDFVGVSSGASLFAATAIVLMSVGSVVISIAALAGAFTSAGLVYLLAWRDGITGYRFILIGIGVSEFFFALVAYVLARAEINDAREAMTWLVGSIGQAGRGEIRALFVAVALLFPLALILSRPLRALELGDDTATALGTRVEACRLGLIAVSIVLVAFATAAAGPILFVALMAGPIARHLNGGIAAAGFVGAIIVLTSDLVAEHLLLYALPTGVVTGAIGAPYLIWLLATANREGRGG